MQSPSLMEASKLSSSTLSPNTTGTGADEDTIGSITKDFSDNFAHKFTPMTWSKSLNTPTPSQAYSINSNMSSVTYMKHAHFNNENDTPMADINQTPMRDLNPEYLYQDGPHVNCPLSVGSQVSNASLESPPVVKVLSPASQFRLKRAVFESKAKAVKSPNRKQRAQNVTVLDNSPSMAPVHMENDISPSCAIESELGDECEAEVPLATAHALPMPMKVLDSIMHEGLDEKDEKEEHGEMQYEEPREKEESEQAKAVEPETIPQPEVLDSEILHVETLEENSSITSDRGISRPVLLFAAALIFALVCLGRVYFGTDDTVGAVSDHYAVMLETPGEVMQLPSDEAVVMLSGLAPIRAKKLRYFTDANFQSRVLPAPHLQPGRYADAPAPRADDWSDLDVPVVVDASPAGLTDDETVEDGGPRRQPELAELAQLPDHDELASDLLLLDEDDIPTPFPTQPDPRLQRVARLATLDPDDGIAL